MNLAVHRNSWRRHRAALAAGPQDRTGPASGMALIGWSTIVLMMTCPAASDAFPQPGRPGGVEVGGRSNATASPNGSVSTRLAAVQAIAINDSRQFDGMLEQAPPFRFAGDAADRSRALDCLALSALYEAGDDPSGERAVMQVVLNRARHPGFPPTLCGVVFQGADRSTGCQFTFTCDGSFNRHYSSAAWSRARRLAAAALDGAVDPRVGSATHYHADYVVPWWSGSLEKVSKVGAHIFYRWPGSWGRPAILRRTAEQHESSVALMAKFTSAPGGRRIPATDAAIDALSSTDDTTRIPSPRPLPPSTMIVPIDAAASSGSWAVDALRRCKGLTACVVLAYQTEDQAAVNRAASPDTREAPLFLFVRDSATAMQVALWNCALVTRPDASQCLPTDRASIARLVRDRETPATAELASAKAGNAKAVRQASE